jgi:4-amino-4-deoxy-L-arabinose transferase-like glycosyltransferase
MSAPNPALVTQRGARRLPRIPLLLLCAAYVLPGVFGRDPWRNADLVAFGQMVAIAEGRTPWWAPTLGGVPGDTALLPHWLGAVFIGLLSPAVDPAFAARVPFALLLGLVLVAVWYTSFHLARTDAAQPLPFAFGGEAAPVDYARAMADGSLLALMATLGLLQLGHETTPEILQLLAMALLLYGLAAAPHRGWQPRAAVLLALPLLAGSGAPAMALAAGLAGAGVCLASRLPAARRLVPWLLAATAAASALAWAFGAWRWRAAGLPLAELPSLARQWLWFMWPAWPLALWTLWRWRGYLSHRHIAVPLVAVGVALVTNVSMGGSDRALMLGLPGLAVLAAFALPTLKRGARAAIDWFSMFFFTACALTIWVMYGAMHTGWPAKPAANIAKLAPGFEPQFSALALLLAVAGSVAWVVLVRWRSGRHREALWKSLVLPASGVALCWLLLMTLWLPLIDYARSPRPLVQRLAQVLPADACVQAPGASPVVAAALEHFGGWQVDASQPGARPNAACPWLLRVERQRAGSATSPTPDPSQWELALNAQRPTERDEINRLYRLKP